MIHADFETRSAVEIKRAGADVYAEHASTDVLCLCYAIGDGDVRLWTPRDPIPPVDLFDALARGEKLAAHNAYFELVIWNLVAAPRYGFPDLDPEQCIDTMAQCYAHGLPGSLLNASTAIGLPGGKDDAGRRAMLKLSRPKKDGGFWEYAEDPATFELLYRTCAKDVVDERELEKRLPALRADEQATWVLDYKINRRGVPIDIESVNKALACIDAEASARNAELRAITGGFVPAASNVGKIVEWLQSLDLDVHSLTKADVRELLDRPQLPAAARRVLEIRQQIGKSSVKKLKAMQECVSEDGRARGLHQYHAAATGRWGGRRIQTQNMTRPEKKIGGEKFDADQVFDLLKLEVGEAAGMIELIYGSVTPPISSAMRGMIAAEPGKRLIASDFSNVEGRVLPWMTGESWKIEMFRAIDRGEGKDNYLVAASGIFGEEIDDPEDPRRQVGKVSELCLGYQGGAGAYANMAAVYGLDVDALYDVVMPAANEYHRANAEASWKDRGKASGMTERAWIAAEVVKQAWRGKHPATDQFWKDIEDAARSSIDQRGTVFSAGRHIKFKCAGSFMFMRLPSGRALAYPFPKLVWKRMPWNDENGRPATKLMPSFFSKIDESKRAKIVRDRGNSATWARVATYGGELTENADQAIARDLLRDAMHRVEARGYPIIMHVHDEIVSERPEGEGSVAELCSIMAELPAWADGLPIAAAGWEGPRFRK